MNTESELLQYLSGDAAIFVEVVQIKGPIEFISDGAPQDDGQTYDKILQEEKRNPGMTEIRKAIAISERVKS